MEWTLAVGIAMTAVVMLSASYFDWRYREVPDIHWWVLGISGIVLTAVSISGGIDFKAAMMLMGSVMILLYILLDVDIPPIASMIYCASMALLFIYPVVTGFDDPVIRRLLVIPICFVFFYVLFIIGVLRGGADAKCLMTLAMVFQLYPQMGDLPLIAIPSLEIQTVISFPIAVLFHASLFSFAWLFWTIFRKIHRREDPVEMYTLSWYRMSIDEARRSHVWPKQDVVNGMVVNVNGVADEGALDRLESIGAKDVWVTPIIPFMVPMTAAIFFVLFAGSLLNIPFSL